jgi:acyl-CoA thioesterase-1
MSRDEPGRHGEAIRYLALGDSYTIGTGASKPARNYPSILANRISEATGRKVDLTNPAVNGFTTLDLIDAELKYVRRLLPQLVSILIGVNDLVQGRTPEEYGASLRKIYDAVASLQLPSGRAVAISVPNWSVAPAARDFGDPARLRRLTDAFNTIAKNEADSRAFTWIDISAASTGGAGTKGWISGDRLHPGDPQYAAWADVIWEVVKETWTAV